VNVNQSDIGKRFKVRNRYSDCRLIALSGNGQTAFIDIRPDEPTGRATKDRYESVPVSDLVRRLKQEAA
jgi:hypothetical protein